MTTYSSSQTEMRIQLAQRFYNVFTLLFYDLIVYGLSSAFIWKVPTKFLIQFYNKNLTNTHLEVGVGTGFLLDESTFLSDKPHIVLMDMNTTCLKKTAQRIRRYAPYSIEYNILAPTQLTGEFDSIAINYVFHCVPGSFKEKGVAFLRLKKLMKPSGVLFGCTLLTHGVQRNWASRLLMKRYNKMGIFNNEQDSLVELEAVLRAVYHYVQIIPKGSAAVFRASDMPLNGSI